MVLKEPNNWYNWSGLQFSSKKDKIVPFSSSSFAFCFAFSQQKPVPQATISYEQEETQLARSILDQCHPDSEDRQVFEGALLWKEKRQAVDLDGVAGLETGKMREMIFKLSKDEKIWSNQGENKGEIFSNFQEMKTYSTRMGDHV